MRHGRELTNLGIRQIGMNVQAVEHTTTSRLITWPIRCD